MSDYGYGVLTPGVIAKLAEFQADTPRMLVVDSKRLELYRDASPTAIKPNFGEALQLLGESGPTSPADRAEWMVSQGPRLLEIIGAGIVAVTLDTEGALVFERDRPPYRTFARTEQPSRAVGAGDTFATVLALALAAGAETPAVADLASVAATVVVGKDGTASCDAAELRERVSPAEDRLRVLSALGCVDHVVPFDEDTPHELIRIVRPDVLVKGSDYTRATLPEATLVEQLGGIVEILPFVADRSTTDIIARIRRAYGEMPDGVTGGLPAAGQPVGTVSGPGYSLAGRNGA